MKLLALGTGPFAVPTLFRLAASHHQLLGVVTRPPRGRRSAPAPMQWAAEQLKLPLWQPATLNSDEARTELRRLGPDLMVVCDYGEILQAETLAAAPQGGINLHASLLPKYRGAAPVQWALLQGETQTGNTVIQMTPGLDAGPCLGVQRVSIDPDESAGDLEARLAQLGADLVLQTVDRLSAGDRSGTPQDPALQCKAPRLRKEDGQIDWNRTALQIHNQIRALDPWPRAFTWWLRQEDEPMRLLVHKSRPRDWLTGGESASMGRAPGTIVDADTHLGVQTGKDVLELLALQLAGKKAMATADFLRGTPLSAGDLLGTP